MAKKKTKKTVKKSAGKKAAKTTKKVNAKAALRPRVVKKAAKKLVKKAAPKSPKKVAPKKTAMKNIVAQATAPTSSAESPAKKKASSEPKPAPQVPSPSIQIGNRVPALSLENTDGYTVNLSELAAKNRHLIVYFYPKDDTPGCTKEACDFRDNLNRITEQNASIVGVSPDSKESHQNFVNKYEINFTLLADPNHELAEKLGVWKHKQFMGNSYMGVERSTFLFTDGKLSRVWSPVKVDGHVSEIIEALAESQP